MAETVDFPEGILVVEGAAGQQVGVEADFAERQVGAVHLEAALETFNRNAPVDLLTIGGVQVGESEYS